MDNLGPCGLFPVQACFYTLLPGFTVPGIWHLVPCTSLTCFPWCSGLSYSCTLHSKGTALLHLPTCGCRAAPAAARAAPPPGLSLAKPTVSGCRSRSMSCLFKPAWKCWCPSYLCASGNLTPPSSHNWVTEPMCWVLLSCFSGSLHSYSSLLCIHHCYQNSMRLNCLLKAMH